MAILSLHSATLYILFLYVYIGEMNSALSASPVALCECFCREKNKNEKKMTTTLIIVFDTTRYNNDIFAVSPPMHVLAIYFDSTSCYNMCVYIYERAMCGDMEIEFRSLRLFFFFFLH